MIQWNEKKDNQTCIEQSIDQYLMMSCAESSRADHSQGDDVTTVSSIILN